MSKPIRTEQLIHALQQCHLYIEAIAPTSSSQPALTSLKLSEAIDAEAIDAEAIDDMALQALCDEADTDILIELINCYLKETPKLLKTIQGTVVKQDAIALRHASHTLKSSSATLGAIHLPKLCAELEKLAGQGEIANLEPQIAQLTAEYKRVAAALQLKVN
ncbi:MAG: Hpt domain-containing protein [Leptolyngbyaceae cyanobacterium RM2_2_4]|nr:Hpt domain-containing protein [Leptolyngbyaceae cyanobacterium RM2_2_4]